MGVTHVKAVRASSKAKLGAVVSSDDRKLAGDFSEVGGNLDTTSQRIDLTGVAKYRTLDEALADPLLDAVDLCLPTHLHAPYAIAALRAGKHVLIEKPLALNAAECAAIEEEARRADRIAMCAQVLRFFPMYSVLSPGPALSARFRRRCAAPAWGAWLKDKAKSGGGVFDLLIHDVDTMLRLFGEPRGVAATGYENLKAGIDLVEAQFDYGKFAVQVSGGWHPGRYPFSMEYTVARDEGTYEYRFGDGDPVFYGMGAEPRRLSRPEADGYRAQIDYFAECVSAGVQPDFCPLAESANAVRWTLEMEEARWKRA